MADFYNGGKLLNMRDLFGLPPELFFCCGNRSGGKSFFFKRFLIRRFLKRGEKFILFVRFIDDIANAVDGFWADIGPIEFPRHRLRQRPLLHGKAARLILDGKNCGYIIAINDPERIKRNSALFADAVWGFFDEFQSETGKYCTKEVEKFNSIRMSVARGGKKGTFVRHFPVILVSNAVTIFNPYFDYFGVGGDLTPRTKYKRGKGWVLEIAYIAGAAEAIRANLSTIGEREMSYASGNSWLLDTSKFVKKLPGQKMPLMNMRINDRMYCLWRSRDKYYMSQTTAPELPVALVFAESDHDVDTVMVGTSDPLIKTLRTNYMRGCVRFDSQRAKNAYLLICRLAST